MPQTLERFPPLRMRQVFIASAELTLAKCTLVSQRSTSKTKVRARTVGRSDHATIYVSLRIAVTSDHGV